LAPTSSIVPIASEVGAERRMYLPLAALISLVVVLGYLGVEWAIRRFGEHRLAIRRAAGAAAGAAIVLLSVTTIVRNADYATPMTLWRTVVERRPQGRARVALAAELIAANRHDEAIAELREAVADFPDARAALGAELYADNRMGEAVSELRDFMRSAPSVQNGVHARVILGQALAAQGQLDEAARELHAAIAAEPDDALARQALADIALRYRRAANAALQRRDLADAEAEARAALRLDSRDAEAHNVLGVSLATQGRLDEAIAQFREAIADAPGDLRARNNLAHAVALAAAAHG
jgi:protein O-mannosyl-transferase